METTVDLEPEAYRIAQAVAAETHQSLGEVLSDALLSRYRRSEPSREIETDEHGWPVFYIGRTVTSEDVAAMIEED